MTASTPLDRLPEQLVLFVNEYAACGSGRDAALRCGVHPDRAAIWASQSLRDPNVRAAAEYVVRSRFLDAGPLALNVLVKFAKNEDEKYEPKLQLEAAKDLLTRSGYTAKDMRDAKAGDKDLREMTRDELLATINDAESVLSDRAKVVEIAPKFDAIAPQDVDIEG